MMKPGAAGNEEITAYGVSVSRKGKLPSPREWRGGGGEDFWLEHEPAFNVDGVRTPALYTLERKLKLAADVVTLYAESPNHSPFECF